MLRVLLDFKVYGSTSEEINRRMFQLIGEYCSIEQEDIHAYTAKNLDIELRVEQNQKNGNPVEGFTGHVVAKFKTYS